MVLSGNGIFCESITNLVIFGLKFLLAFDASPSDMSAWIFVHSFDITINCSLFEGNPDLNTSGRPLLLIDSNVSISNSLFKWNKVKFGGIILAHNSTALLNNNTFTGNRASGEGGTLDVQITTIILNSSEDDNGITLEISTFAEGRANGDGGAIFASLSTIILNCNIFIENSAHGSGGAISSIEESTLVLNGNHFEGNKALFHGGAIFASDSMIDINDGSHIQHTNYSSNSLEVTEGMAYFSSNTADIGGAIYVSDCTVAFGGSVVVFSSNSARSNGGVLVSVGSSASFQECFSGSSLIVRARQMYFKGIMLKLGGALYQEGGSCFMINNSNSSIEFTANLATSGGAIFRSNSHILAEVGEMIIVHKHLVVHLRLLTSLMLIWQYLLTLLTTQLGLVEGLVT